MELFIFTEARESMHSMEDIIQNRTFGEIERGSTKDTLKRGNIRKTF